MKQLFSGIGQQTVQNCDKGENRSNTITTASSAQRHTLPDHSTGKKNPNRAWLTHWVKKTEIKVWAGWGSQNV